MPGSEPSIRRIAFLGTGIMGSHMSRRLAQAGFDVRAWNRTPEKLASLASFGVAASPTPSDAVTGADAVVVMLSTGPVAEEVLFAPDASGKVPAEVIPRGALVIMMSSIPVDTARSQAERLAVRGVRYVDAPVSGGERGARDGTLAIMAGGDAADVEAAGRLFAALGRVTRMGEVGTGELTKLANQIIVGGTLLAVAEAFNFARAGGADLHAVRTALSGGFGDSTILRQHGERMAKGDYTPGSPSMQQLKDLRTAQAQAREMSFELELLPLLERVFADMSADGRGGQDVAAIFEQVAVRAARRGAPS
jgi:2-hydroxy-3-oxopropionate reductase